MNELHKKYDTLEQQVHIPFMTPSPQPNPTTLYSTQVQTIHGDCIILATENGICYVSTPGDATKNLVAAKKWALKRHHTEEFLDGINFPLLKKAVQEINEYCTGTLKNFSGPFDFYGTDFQKKVWQQLTRIPYGETKTYGQIAALAGNAKAARAVGMANNKNPIAIMIPCHRVVGSTGKLVGYAGGLKTKEWLLALEQQ